MKRQGSPPEGPEDNKAQGLSQSRGQIDIATTGTGMIEITSQVAGWLGETGCRTGLLSLFVRHTSASLTIQENADRDVQYDLVDALSRLAPEDGPYRHTTEGADDMPAHIKSMLTSVSLSIPVDNAQMVLGTWQGIYLIEHRSRPHRRSVVLHVVGVGGLNARISNPPSDGLRA